MDVQEPAPVQMAATRALGKVPGEAVGTFLISKWRVLTGPVRSQAAEAMLQDPARFPQILKALQQEDVQAWTLNFSQKRRLLMNRDPKIRDRHARFWTRNRESATPSSSATRLRLIANGDSVRGKRVFQEICAKCHKLDGIGAEVGS